MAKALMRVLASLGGLLLVAALVVLVSWLWPLSAAQKRALAALEAPRDMPGSNAYVTVATLGMEGLTLEQRQARVDAYVAEYAKWHADFQDFVIKNRGEWDEGAVPDKPQLPGGEVNASTPDTAVLCPGASPSCLRRVREQPEAVAAALLPYSAVLERMDELATHGHYLSPLPLDAATPIPAMKPLFLPLSAHALAHVQGDSQRALAGLCRDAGIGRMLMNHGDSLLVGMVGGSLLNANATLLAEVLAELPADTPLPANCAAALAPLSPQETSYCASMQAEFVMVRDGYSLTEQITSSGLGLPGEHWWATPQTSKVLYNREKSLGRAAETMGAACLPETWQAIAEDKPLPAPMPSLWRLECAANALGCITSSIAAPAYASYMKRPRDTAARLSLLQAVLWLRTHAAEQAGMPVQERLQQLPAELRSAQHPITLSADGGALEMPGYGKDKDVLLMPLPQVLQARQ